MAASPFTQFSARYNPALPPNARRFSKTLALLVLRSLGVLSLLLPFAATTGAAVTPLRCFHFGDADSEPGPGPEVRYGMAPGAIATSTKDSASTNPLITSGSPVYTSEGANEFSARSIAFDGTTQRATTPGPDALTTDFGVEAWVKPTTAAGKQVIVYCGTPGVDGWGLIQQADGQFAAEFGGVATFGGGAVVPGTWTHLAFVIRGGTATFHINGAQTGPGVEAAPIATGPAAELSIAAAPTTPVSDFFGGQIDKLRVFTFASGAFAVEDLLYTPPLKLALSLDGPNVTGSWSLKHWLHHAEASTDLVTLPWTPVPTVNPVGQDFTFSEPRVGKKFFRLNRKQDLPPYLPVGKFIVISYTDYTNVTTTKNVTDYNAANANRIIGHASSMIDASAFVDPANVDGGADAMDFTWWIAYPLVEPYTAKGITGYRKPFLKAVRDSYVQQPSTGDSRDPGVGFHLTVRSRRTGLETYVPLRAQVQSSGLNFSEYNDCQLEVEACSGCPCTIDAALPSEEAFSGSEPRDPPY